MVGGVRAARAKNNPEPLQSPTNLRLEASERLPLKVLALGQSRKGRAVGIHMTVVLVPHLPLCHCHSLKACLPQSAFLLTVWSQSRAPLRTELPYLQMTPA